MSKWAAMRDVSTTPGDEQRCWNIKWTAHKQIVKKARWLKDRWKKSYYIADMRVSNSYSSVFSSLNSIGLYCSKNLMPSRQLFLFYWHVFIPIVCSFVRLSHFFFFLRCFELVFHINSVVVILIANIKQSDGDINENNWSLQWESLFRRERYDLVIALPSDRRRWSSKLIEFSKERSCLENWESPTGLRSQMGFPTCCSHTSTSEIQSSW